jgi:hypothetical protein
MDRTRWTLRRTIAVALIGGVCWMAYRSVTDSLEAERNYQATRHTVDLVGRFLAERGHWPGSWEELKNFQDLNGTTRQTVAEMQQRVQIDVRVDAGDIARQDPMDFNAIQPIDDLYYEYRDQAVPSLQATIRTSISRADAK